MERRRWFCATSDLTACALCGLKVAAKRRANAGRVNAGRGQMEGRWQRAWARAVAMEVYGVRAEVRLRQRQRPTQRLRLRLRQRLRLRGRG